MPSEVRRITFSHHEVREALENHGDHGTVTLDGTLSTSTAHDGQAYIVATQNPVGNEPPQSTKHDATGVGAALVKFCLDRGVPIPRHASRSLGLHGGSVVLFLHLGEEAEESSLALPDFFKYDFYG